MAPAPGEDVAALLDRLEGIEIEVYPRARVVVNERTGTVVIGGTVRLQPVSILHGGLSVNVITQNLVSQPNPLSGGTTQVVPQTTVQVQDKPVNRIDLKEGATVEDLVQDLQRTGAGARDVISILQAMKEAGALEAQMMKELMKPLTDGDALTSSGDAEGSGGALGEFASEALGRALSAGGGFGIANQIVKELSH